MNSPVSNATIAAASSAVADEPATQPVAAAAAGDNFLLGKWVLDADSLAEFVGLMAVPGMNLHLCHLDLRDTSSVSDLRWPAVRNRQKPRFLPAVTEPMSEKAPQATFSNEGYEPSILRDWSGRTT